MRRFSSATAVTITDPLVKYQALVAAGLYSPDPAQHRLARHLHKIYVRIKDYSPQLEYRQRLNQVARLTEQERPLEEEDGGRGILALRHHAIWRNPLFQHLLPKETRDSLSLTRVLSNHETAIEIDSPKGLFLSGEVGTGKSMLLDLLAEGLPTSKKRRWHFNTFMLHTISQLEKHREAHSGSPFLDSEHSLLWMGKKLVDESPILFLDEFQLPDRAASKILSNLFIRFFQLGGVLIASSNRMPEELQKATGIQYTPSSRGLLGRVLGLQSQSRGELFGHTSDFAAFLEVLKARCDFWQMEGAQDWRRREETSSPTVSVASAESIPSSQVPEAVLTDESANHDNELRKKPHHYFLSDEEDSLFQERIQEIVPAVARKSTPWEPSTLIVYGRRVCTPRHYKGFVIWDFDELVGSFGPADYITMASSYHTFIIDRIPVLTILAKNEARRFITLLDALYEARCKLVIRAQAPPDDLFFPEKPANKEKARGDASAGPEDATYSETIAEVYQDTVSPFRPNVSYYDTASTTSKYNPDQDSDFGLLQRKPLDFGNASAFTGEDERFAYKRATSRLWEMCGARWHGRTGDWWQPLPMQARHWEGGRPSKPINLDLPQEKRDSAESVGESVEAEELAGLSRWRVLDLQQQSKGGSK